jgi:hypothetical protein
MSVSRAYQSGHDIVLPIAGCTGRKIRRMRQ